jgi:uncharacterized membrane protein
MRGAVLSLAPVLVLALVVAQAAPGAQGPTVTYTISLGEDGSAIWNMEYRTPLLSEADQAAFRNYTDQIQAVYLPEYTALMRQSAAGASTATGRPVAVSGFSADGAVQSGPTGTYGVVHYRCTWTGFARTGASLSVGDVFVGGLYLGKDHALVIRPPAGYSVAEASPAPDLTRDGLVWYGLRSFGAGEPRVELVKEPIPWIPVFITLVLAAVLGAGIYVLRRRSRAAPPGPAPAAAPAAVTLPGTAAPGHEMELEDRILALLAERGGSLFQSEIGEALALPKSTVSEAVNRLHGAGRIVKVKKGRENLIRLP